MAKLSLRYWDDPVLSTVCDKIGDSEFGSQLEEFGRELIATMLENNGIGLAAPQVGVTKRVFCMSFPDHEALNPIVVCNPSLVLSGGITAEREGCLSLPNIYQQVRRAATVVMRFQTPTGQVVEMPIDAAWDARVAQHEYDHLDGIMFFDFRTKRPEPWGARMTKQMSKSALREWEKAKKGFRL